MTDRLPTQAELDAAADAHTLRVCYTDVERHISQALPDIAAADVLAEFGFQRAERTRYGSDEMLMEDMARALRTLAGRLAATRSALAAAGAALQARGGALPDAAVALLAAPALEPCAGEPARPAASDAVARLDAELARLAALRRSAEQA